MKKPKLQFTSIAIEKLVPADWNYKKFDNLDMQKKLVANIKKNGQVENIIVREIEKGFFEVVNGNHRFLAMKELKYTEVMCCNMGKISLNQAKRIAVETNETGFDADESKLAALLNDVILSEEDFHETNPFTEDQMKEFNALNLDDEEIEDVTPSAKKTQKTKTISSLAGDKYTTLKLEATPETAEEFTALIGRFSGDKSTESTALHIICGFMAKYDDKQILTTVGVKQPAGKAKKSTKATATA